MAKSQTELKKLIKNIKWGTQKEMPFSQGWVVNEMIKRYKIPAKKWGYDNDIIGIETKRQRILWKDQGGRVDFLGLVDKKLKRRKK